MQLKNQLKRKLKRQRRHNNMFNDALISKIIEQGFIGLGIFLTVWVYIVISRQNKEYNKKMFDITEKISVAMTRTSDALDGNSQVLLQNLQKVDSLPTKAEVNQLEARVIEKHKDGHKKIDDLHKKVDVINNKVDKIELLVEKTKR